MRQRLKKPPRLPSNPAALFATQEEALADARAAIARKESDHG
jgi:hypothetical protein